MFEMHFYVTRTPDGNIHVQNAVGPYMGQHHVHTRKDFAIWKADIPKGQLHDHGRIEPCDCGLAPGEVREG